MKNPKRHRPPVLDSLPVLFRIKPRRASENLTRVCPAMRRAAKKFGADESGMRDAFSTSRGIWRVCHRDRLGWRKAALMNARFAVGPIDLRLLWRSCIKKAPTIFSSEPFGSNRKLRFRNPPSACPDHPPAARAS